LHKAIDHDRLKQFKKKSRRAQAVS